jgi:NAD(P)-dependent dehydrogenase (short-subunit alcohol dehydrogenase family)
MYLITGAGGGVGGVSRTVVELLLDGGERVRAMVHRDDERAQQLRALGADVVVGDLTRAPDIVDALAGVRRMFFNMSVSADYLLATAEVCAVAKERGHLDALVNMSQMTVSQMTLTSTSESEHQRLHWLAEHVLNWSGLPVIHVRPTVFLQNPLFSMLGAQSVRDRGVLALPFEAGRTSPVAAADVAAVVAAILLEPADRIGAVYELTGPEALDMDGLVNNAANALAQPLGEMTADALAKSHEVNLRGPVLLVQAALPHLKASSHASVVNMISTGAFNFAPGTAIYSSNKAALMSFTRSMAAEYASAGIRVNAIAPGPVDTDMMRNNPPEAIARMANSNLMKRLAKPDEMVGAALMLATDAGSYLTGTVIIADGGGTPR